MIKHNIVQRLPWKVAYVFNQNIWNHFNIVLSTFELQNSSSYPMPSNAVTTKKHTLNSTQYAAIKHSLNLTIQLSY